MPDDREPEADIDTAQSGAIDAADALVLELVERANDRFQSRLDAIDTLLVGLLAATLALCGLVIDRLNDFGQGLWFLAAAYVCCAVGLIVGNLVKKPRDAPDPLKAIVGITNEPLTAIQGLSDDIAKNWRDSQ